MLRWFSGIFEGIRLKIFEVFSLPGTNNGANTVSKIPVGPKILAREMTGIFGQSDELEAYQAEVEAKWISLLDARVPFATIAFRLSFSVRRAPLRVTVNPPF
jgi:hypothetical protein